MQSLGKISSRLQLWLFLSSTNSGEFWELACYYGRLWIPSRNVLTASGHVWTCGHTDRLEPPQVGIEKSCLQPPERFNNRKIVMVASGARHLLRHLFLAADLALDEDGILWTWGDNINTMNKNISMMIARDLTTAGTYFMRRVTFEWFQVFLFLHFVSGVSCRAQDAMLGL